MVNFQKVYPAKNTVNKVMNLMDRENILKGKKYLIKIKKNIPQKAGLGGGSMNAASF